jgi:hypothetical protein
VTGSRAIEVPVLCSLHACSPSAKASNVPSRLNTADGIRYLNAERVRWSRSDGVSLWFQRCRSNSSKDMGGSGELSGGAWCAWCRTGVWLKCGSCVCVSRGTMLRTCSQCSQEKIDAPAIRAVLHRAVEHRDPPRYNRGGKTVGAGAEVRRCRGHSSCQGQQCTHRCASVVSCD